MVLKDFLYIQSCLCWVNFLFILWLLLPTLDPVQCDSCGGPWIPGSVVALRSLSPSLVWVLWLPSKDEFCWFLHSRMEMDSKERLRVARTRCTLGLHQDSKFFLTIIMIIFLIVLIAINLWVFPGLQQSQFIFFKKNHYYIYLFYLCVCTHLPVVGVNSLHLVNFRNWIWVISFGSKCLNSLSYLTKSPQPLWTTTLE